MDHSKSFHGKMLVLVTLWLRTCPPGTNKHSCTCAGQRVQAWPEVTGHAITAGQMSSEWQATRKIKSLILAVKHIRNANCLSPCIDTCLTCSILVQPSSSICLPSLSQPRDSNRLLPRGSSRAGVENHHFADIYRFTGPAVT